MTTTECIEWAGARNSAGYGYRRYEGKMRRVHRIAYCEANGLSLDDIDGKVVRHKCDNPPCVRPDHLLLGTHQDNMDDRAERGRVAKGEDLPGCVLSDEQVAEIRARYVRGCRTNGCRALAREFGVSQAHISDIVNGKKRRAS